MNETSNPSITVSAGLPRHGNYVWSPFVAKLEARLRFAGVAYNSDTGSLSKAPRGKIPYVTIQLKGSEEAEIIADSSVIASRLMQDGLLLDLNAKLSPGERAQDYAICAMLEDKLYFYNTYEKWIENYYVMRPHVLHAVPWPVQIVVGMLVYRTVTKTLHGQGTGRFTYDEIRGFVQTTWEQVNALLVEAKSRSSVKDSEAPFWLFGRDEPTTADTVVFGFVATTLVCEAAPDSMKTIRQFPTVLDYARRIHCKYFPDYKGWDDINHSVSV